MADYYKWGSDPISGRTCRFSAFETHPTCFSASCK